MWVYAGSRTVVYRDRAEASALDESQRALWANDQQLALRAANKGLRRLRNPDANATPPANPGPEAMIMTLALTLTLPEPCAACRFWRGPPRRGAPA